MTRTIITVGGSDRVEFLQGLVTNDVGRAAGGIVYAALLTPQGKYIADFFIIGRPDALWIDVDAALADGLLARLSMYRLRADVTLEKTDIAVSRHLQQADGALADPRHPALGWRSYDTQDRADSTDWTALNVAHVIPASGIELTPETYILEAGFERLNGIDFRKGCYVGQEIAARMKHKTELRKGLVQVEIEGSCPVGTDIKLADKTVGTVYTQHSGRALAHLRFDRAGDGMMAGDAAIRWSAP